ncbi:MAG TPA: alpha-amylase family glycosyl hydrolase, partial [Flavisolibacter sp.]|nr:alpha-amylase family glycosyl hydrolase [Flavisolibacter sp.]
MKRLLLVWIVALCNLGSYAQLLTWTPAFPTETDNITISVDATKGNQGLAGYTGNVYVHIGAITNLSSGATNWLHVPFTWGSTEAAALATPDGPNKWKFTINNPRSFFNLAAGEQLKAIAILFRAGNCSDCAAQRNLNGSDMYVPIYDASLHVRFTEPPLQPLYQPVPEPINKTIGSTIAVTAVSSQPSNLKLYLNGTLIQTATGATSITANPVLAASGNQVLLVEADNGTVVQKDSVLFFVSPPANIAALPAGTRPGINYESDLTAATLVLYAPQKTRVTLIGEFTGSNWTEQSQFAMNNTPDGKYWWLRLTGLTPGKEYAYQYLVDGTLKIADPYAEKILDPYPGENNQSNDQNISSSTYPGLRAYPAGQTGIVSILQTAEPAYNWSVNNFTRPDKRGLVIYELLPRDFVAAHDWKTIRDSLHYLKNLGINAIELLPFNEFEGNNSWGYNPDFYFAPDKYYGPKNSLKEFIDSCHKNGIAVIMDIALNHSFGLSPLVQLYWDAANSRPATNNPWFNPVPKHPFNVGFDMNHESADTKYLFGRVVEHWLQQYRLDGFRFDLSKGFTQVASCDANGGNCNVNAWSNYDASRVAIWKGYYDSVQNKSSNAYVILEHLSVNSEEKELAEYGMLPWGNMSGNYQEASMGYLGNSDLSYGIYSAPSRGWTKPHLVTYMESHDEERITYKNLAFGNASGGYNVKDTATALKRMELSAAFLLTIPGPKMIWQFGELGYSYSITSCHPGNVVPQPYPKDSCRLSAKPAGWDFLKDARRKHVYDVYSSLIHLRSHPWYRDAFLAGSVNQNVGSGIAVKWISVTTDSSKLLVIGNFDVTPQSASVTFPAAGTWFDYLNNTTFDATGSPQNFTLQPGEYRVYVNRNVNALAVTATTAAPWNGLSLEARSYPNPARSNFILDLQLPSSGPVHVDLYNALGQFQHTVYQGLLVRGRQKLVLKAP